MKKYYKYDSEFGDIYIAEENGAITNINKYRNYGGELEETPLIKNAFEQIKEYFLGERKTFDMPLNPKGTDFQKKVWDSLLKIPFGEVKSYKDIAIDIGNEKACRAVGNANNKNPIFIVIPCHRVVGSNKKLVGYAGGLDMKKGLLELEGNKFGEKEDIKQQNGNV